MSGRLDGYVALVTGAGQGIGRGCAQALADDGATVVAIGRTAAKVEAVAAEIEAGGGNAIAITADVGRRDQVDAAVERVRSELGRIDALVNNAQQFVFRTLEETTLDDLDVAYRSGTLGTFHCMQACLPLLRVRGGSIVNMATSSALSGEARFASYAMAKEAVRALTRVAATEWGPDDIRVNCVCPSASSPAYEEWQRSDPEAAERIAAARPLGRMGDPLLDVGRAVSSLVGDEFRYLTGATLMLNGGRVYLG